MRVREGSTPAMESPRIPLLVCGCTLERSLQSLPGTDGGYRRLTAHVPRQSWFIGTLGRGCLLSWFKDPPKGVSTQRTRKLPWSDGATRATQWTPFRGGSSSVRKKERPTDVLCSAASPALAHFASCAKRLHSTSQPQTAAKPFITSVWNMGFSAPSHPG